MTHEERKEILEILRKRFGGQTVAELRGMSYQGASMDVGQWWIWSVSGRSKSKGVTVLGAEHEDGWRDVLIPWSEIAKDGTQGQIDIYDLMRDDND